MLEKTSLDTVKLARISVALDYDFFQCYRPEGISPEGENAVMQERVASLEKIIEEKEKLIEEKERTIKILMESR